MEYLSNWIKRQLSNPQLVFLFIAILAILVVIHFFGNKLAPLLWSIVIAYLLEGIIKRLSFSHLPRTLMVLIVFFTFLVFLVSIIFVLLPILYDQIFSFIRSLPAILSSGQTALMALPERYPDLFSVQQAEQIMDTLHAEITSMGQVMLENSLSGVSTSITVLIYLILVPILVFFMLLDKDKIINWFRNMLPRNNQMAISVWHEVDMQIGNYIRGKFWEVLIVWFACYVVFSYLGLQYAMLLSVLVGLSVIIPYVGAALVTIPVVLVAWFQWGMSSDFIYVIVAYFIIQALDGNVLVPLLFSGVVNLHPVAIITAVLVFGGIWGLWGVFFAIPLATLVQAIIRAWPKEAEM